MQKKKAIVIGAGFSGLSAACALAKQNFDVTVLEKNESAGGRASVFFADGFTFDMGPSWYWMPDVFEWFFESYGKKVSEFYSLKRLDPGYRIYFGKDDIVDVPASQNELYQLFEQLEKGAAENLRKFLKDAAYKYKVGMQDLIFQPCNSPLEFLDFRLIKSMFKIQLFTSLRKEVYEKFKHEKIRKLLEFPVYFLGALPSNTPALYSILNYADLVLGTWYPQGGMFKIIEGMQEVATSLNVKFIFNAPVTEIITDQNQVVGVKSKDQIFDCDALISSADYAHTEKDLLKKKVEKNYGEKFWDKKVFAPSCLIFYLGIKGKLKNVLHHNLFFDQSFKTFADEIYVNPKWPSNPLFYISVPSITDTTVAPDGDENLFILIPLAPGLVETESLKEKYFEIVIERLESFTGENIKERIIFKRDFAPSDFVKRYHAYKGNAYGLANTLMQTAIFKPKLRNKKLKNMVYAGQLTVPGPGVPPSIISGYIAAQELIKRLKNH